MSVSMPLEFTPMPALTLTDTPKVRKGGGRATGIRILLAESIPLVETGLRTTLEDQGGHSVVASVARARDALAVLQREPIDVLIACVELEDQSGIHLLHAARRLYPGLRCLLLSEAESEEELYMAFKVGAAGYFSKMVPTEQLLTAVQQVADGSVLLSTDALAGARRSRARADRLLEQMDNATQVQQYLPLSHRELEVVKLIAQGNGNKHIAHSLGISDQTVKNHITAILRKLGVNDRTHAAIYALQRGWINDVQT